MKDIIKIKKWQLLRHRSTACAVDLRAHAFLSIGKRAFRRQPLQSLLLPSEVSAIKSEAFYKCRELVAVTLPENGQVGLSYGVFRGCERLERIEHSERLAVIGERAFEGCTSLESIILSRSLHRVGEKAFYGCTALKTIRLPGSIESLGRSALAGCTGLETVDLAELSCASAELLRGCSALREIELPQSWESIPVGFCRDCTALKSVTIPERVRRIEAHAFDTCTALSSLTLPLGLQSIGAFAFANTLALREVHLPHSVKRLGFGAFGLGKRPEGEKLTLTVDTEYMERRLRRLLRLCGSSGCVKVLCIGKTLEERARERRRKTLDGDPAHLLDRDAGDI